MEKPPETKPPDPSRTEAWNGMVAVLTPGGTGGVTPRNTPDEVSVKPGGKVSPKGAKVSGP